MHSRLQAEFRLTQKLLRSSFRDCSRRTQSPRRSFHRSRTFQASQNPRNDASSETPVPPTEDSNGKDKPDTINEPPLNLPSFPPTSTQFTIQHGGGIPDDTEPNHTYFYGSSENRRRRTRANKELPEPVKPPPAWFVDNNVTLWGQGRLSRLRQNLYTDDPYDLSGLPASKLGFDSGSGNQTSSTDQEPIISEGISSVGNESSEIHSDPSTTNFRISRNRTYHIDVNQYAEINLFLATSAMPVKTRDVHHEPAVKQSHLLLHYAGKDGDFLLDSLVETLTRRSIFDLITLDVQDISELISSPPQSPELSSDEGRLLSYAVLDPDTNSGKYAADSDGTTYDVDEMNDVESVDEDDHHENPFEVPEGSQPGMPFILGKPITIALKDFMGGRGGSARSDLFKNGGWLTETFEGPGSSGRSPVSPFTSLVEGLLSSATKKREGLDEASRTKLTKHREEIFKNSKKVDTGKAGTILHIKDVKAIQETSIGGQFLGEIYDQVQKRRKAGETIFIIGTECTRRDTPPYTPSRIKEMQRLKPHEISRTLVITPRLPDTESKLLLKRDGKRKTTLANMRHIWETYKVRSGRDFLGLKAGFWTPEFYDEAFPVESKLSKFLAARILSFSDISRLVAYLLIMQDPENRNNLESIQQCQESIMRSETSKTKWAAENAKPRNSKMEARRSKENSKLSSIRNTATKHEKKLLSGVIEAAKISTTFNDVHAPIETIDALQTLTTLSLIRPDAFKYGVLSSDKIPGLLLYGPPGTGKTLLAKAVAKESGATMLEVSAADINDMYVGEGEKNVKALFSLAKKLSPCVVFLDEADAMFSARSNFGRRVSHRELLNQFLKEWDGMSNDSGSAFIMVATNRPSDLDDAVLRRLPRRLLVDLPTEQDRQEILKIHLKNENLAEDVSLSDIAKRTPLYSGSDLKNLSVAAALSAVREENNQAKQHRERGEEGEYQYPEKRTLTKKHFDTALEEITASISEDMASLKDIKKFDEQFGDKKGKKKRPKWGFKSVKEAEKVLDTVKVRE